MAYDLARRRDALRSERVGLRKAIERLENSIRFGAGGGMHYEKMQALADLRMRLRGTEREYTELCTMLGETHRLQGPVRLNRSSTVANAAARRAQPARRVETRSTLGYMTRAMRGS